MPKKGPIRCLDELGRMVLPIDVRRSLDLSYGQALEVVMAGDEVILRKHEPGCAFCDAPAPSTEFKGKLVCNRCVRELAGSPATQAVPVAAGQTGLDS